MLTEAQRVQIVQQILEVTELNEIRIGEIVDECNRFYDNHPNGELKDVKEFYDLAIKDNSAMTTFIYVVAMAYITN